MVMSHAGRGLARDLRREVDEADGATPHAALARIRWGRKRRR